MGYLYNFAEKYEKPNTRVRMFGESAFNKPHITPIDSQISVHYLLSV